MLDTALRVNYCKRAVGLYSMDKHSAHERPRFFGVC
jgi:hypothetical protein